MILGIDHLTFYVPAVEPWVGWFESQFDFHVVRQDPSGVFLQSGAVVLSLQVPQDDYLARHPPGIAEICFLVSDLAQIQRTLGGEALPGPGLGVRVVGDLTHRFCTTPSFPRLCGGFAGIDHVVLNVDQGQMQPLVAWYERVLGWQVLERYNITGVASALTSCVVVSQNQQVQIPINESVSAQSQIQEFLDYNRGAGVQHVALTSLDIVRDVTRLKQQGVAFLKTEGSSLEGLGILVDANPDLPGEQLLQIFTEPIFNEPTFFFELVQRQGQRRGFGEANFRALFIAMEQAQSRRTVPT